MKGALKITLWSAAAVLLLLALLMATFVLLVQHNSGFRQYLLAKVEAIVYESSRARLQVRDFHLSLSAMSVAMDDVVLRGTEPAQAEPLLRIDHLKIGISIDSVLGRRWHLRAMMIEHPVVHFVVDASGNNNLPKPPAKGSSSTELFDLGVRRLLLQRGEIYYNDRQSRLEADLNDLELSAHFEPSASEYQGRVGYQQGKIIYANYTPVAHSLKADFAFNPRKISVEHLQLVAGQSSFAGNATVEGYNDPNPRVQANYDALLATSELARILELHQAPAGEVRLTGFLTYQNLDHRPLLEAVSLWGMLTSPELSIHSATLQTSVRNVAAKYKLENGTAEIQNLRAKILGGTLEARATVRDIAGRGEGRLQASLKNVSLSVLQTASTNNPMREAHLAGTVNADAEATWGKALANLAGRANLSIKASLGESPATPLEGVIHADYSQRARELALHNSYLRTPQTSLTLDGTISRFSRLQFHLQARDLHEAELLVKSFNPSIPGPQRSGLGLYGAGQMQGTIAGALDRLQLRAQIALTNFGVKGSRWKSLRAAINADPSQVAVSQGELLGEMRGRIAFSLQSALHNWSYSPSNPINARITASSISLADLDRLANRDDPVTGTLTLDLAIQGTQLNPRGRGSLVLENATVAQEKIQHAEAQFEGNGEVVNVGLHARMPAGNTEGSLAYFPKTESYQARLKASNLRIEKFASVAARNVQIAGAINVNVEGEGTLSHPEFTATVAIPVLQLRRLTVEGVNFQARMREGVAQITFDSRVAQTYVKAGGTVGMTRPYQADVRLDTGNIPLQDLLALYAPGRAEGFTAQTELHASMRGPLADKSRLELHLEAPMLTASYKEFHLAAVKPIRLDYRDGIAVLQPSSIQGTGTDIQMEATIPVNNPAAAQYLVRGKIDLRAVQLLEPGVESSGQLEFDVDSRRYSGSSGMQGAVRIIDAAVHMPALTLGLDHGNGVLTVSSDRLLITNFQGEVGGGTVTAKGTVTYRPHIQSNIALAAKGVRMRYPEGLRTVLDANLRLAGGPRDSVLSGQVFIDHISFTPDFDLSRFTAQLGEQNVSTPSAFAQNMKLDLTLQSTSEVNLTSNQLSLQGRADMRITGTAANPVLLGRANLTGGEMLLAGNRYVVQNGTVDFLNPVRTEPVVNLQVRTEVDQYNITLNISGPMERLHINYTSDPALPPADIINLLAFGKTTEAQAATSPGFSTAGAQSLLAQGIGNVVSTGVAKFAGLPHVSIDPALRGSGQDPGARISVQQRVTSNLFVTYSTDVTQTQRPAIGVDYQLNRRWSIRATRDQNGGFGVSGRYRKDF